VTCSVLAVDTNVLVYAHRRETRDHEAAVALVGRLAEGRIPWALPWPCVYEFFSVVTNPRIWRQAASSPEQAWGQLDAWLGSPTIQLLGETEGFARILARFVRRPRVRGPVVHDARIAALCVAHGVEALLTRDRDFALFAELETLNPFA
jgi:toxin-antitoxin system PIN domain toxin